MEKDKRRMTLSLFPFLSVFMSYIYLFLEFLKERHRSSAGETISVEIYHYVCLPRIEIDPLAASIGCISRVARHLENRGWPSR